MVVFFTATEIGDVPPATATGVVLSGTMGGSTIGPPSVAFLAGSFGYRSGWALAAALLTASDVLSFRSPSVRMSVEERVSGSPRESPEEIAA